MPSTPERSGSFATDNAIAVLQELAEDSFTGSLRAESGQVVKVLYFSDGRLACASSTDPGDRLGPLLRDAGQITPQQLDMAEERALAGEALGSVLVSLGFIGPGGLMWGARRQVEKVVASLLSWREGQFRARPAALPDRAVNLKLVVPSVVIGAARILDRREAVTERLGSLDAVLVPRPGSALPPDLEEDAREVWRLMDGSRDLRSVCADSALDDFDTAKIVLAFDRLGLLERAADAAALAGRDRAAAPVAARQVAAAASSPRDAGFGALEDPEDGPVAAVDTPLAGGADDAWEFSDEQVDDPDEGVDLAAATAQMPAHVAALPRDEDAGGRDDVDGDDDADRPEEEGLPFDDDTDAAGFALEPADDDAREGSDYGQGPPPATTAGGSGRRTWLLGAALIVIAVLSVYAWKGLGSTPLDATLEHVPPTATPDPDIPAATSVTPSEPAAGRDTRTVEISTPEPQPAAAAAPSTSPPPRAATVTPSSTSPPPPVATATPEATLGGGDGHGDGLAAFRDGDFARAAALWGGDWATAHGDEFTLQVLVACETATLARAARSVPVHDPLFLLPVSMGGRACYRVGWGTYPNRAAAEAARDQIPAYFTAGGERPVPVQIARLSR